MPPSLREQPFQIYYSKKDNPLENFYIPALSASIQYDRSAGYFSSSALAAAAAGVARLIQNQGRMRLLVGAELSEGDVEAIRQGYDLKEKINQRLLERFPNPQDALLKARLEVLAWMVAEGTLEIKVVLPKDTDGLPIPAQQAQDYYHPKSGIFTDAQGDQVAFTGSINESEKGWKSNDEHFAVYLSWGEGKTYLPHVVSRFERLWNDQDPDWLAVRIPEAVNQRLLKYRPSSAPVLDPFEKEAKEKAFKETKGSYISGSSQSERLLFQFLRDAPFFPNASQLGAATSAVTPWPHQSRVACSALERFPEPELFCDEVGLGKTIEAGLVLRQLLLSGWVKRCLILTPKSVLKQWQEELYEKFALEIPRYDAGKYLDIESQELTISAHNPWDACNVMLASSQLAKRNDRRNQILDANGWDLLIIDEAHHARRKDFKQPIYRPNQLLGLLNDLKNYSKVSCLLLVTATPMQIHPLEVWDLLSVLGLGGRWGADEENYLSFFNEMRKPFNQIDWEFVYDMVRDYLETGGEIEESFHKQVLHDLGPVKLSTLEELPYKQGQRKTLIKILGKESQPYVKELARRHTPLNHYIYRNTRELLREYEKRGILKAKIPTRKPRIERVAMTPEEQALYNRIDEYISHFYFKYENERRGLGFVMTVYRRRLTSSFYAVRRSLERRLAYLEGQLDPQSIFDNDDIEQDELDLDVTEEFIDPVDSEYFQAELDYVKDFIQQLKLLSVNDSKMEVLKDEINQLFKKFSTVLVFTQYTDTMDYIRDQLREVYAGKVACYSGRGGEIWNGITWVVTTKEQVKNDFREGKIRILLGTESASEGINLQTCGVLINYDMPWNPMRVEQRIGRIDRIGQDHEEVWISNYFYKDTIEDKIYQRLADRINWFEVVVGDLQPILAEIGETTRRLAMLPPTEREAQLEIAIKALKQRLQNRKVESLNLDDYLEEEDFQYGSASPVILEQIEHLFTQSNAIKHLFKQHLEIQDAYSLNWKGKQFSVTFSPQVFDAHPDTVNFLTYGSSLFAEILASIPRPESSMNRQLLRCHVDSEIELCSWFIPDPNLSEITHIENFVSLKEYLEKEPKDEALVTSQTLAEAKLVTKDEYASIYNQQEEILKNRRKAEYLTQRVKAQYILLRAAMVEIALGRALDMFDTETYPSLLNEKAILGLQRHGYPWGPLLRLAYEESLIPNEDNPFFFRIANDSRESLQGRFNQLTKEARDTVKILSNALEAMEEKTTQESITVEVNTYQ